MRSPDEPFYPDAKSKTSFQDGLEFQDWVCVQLAKHGFILQNTSSKKYQYEIGENLQKFEIKKDNRCTDTSRLSIEIAEKSRADMPAWTRSGIMRGDSWMYIQGNYKILFVFQTTWLVRYFRERKPPIQTNTPTIQSFYLPFSLAFKCAARVLDFANVTATVPRESIEAPLLLVPSAVLSVLPALTPLKPKPKPQLGLFDKPSPDDDEAA